MTNLVARGATPNVEYHENGLVIRAALSFEDWGDLVGAVSRMAQSSMVWLGDLWLYGEDHFGEMTAQAVPEGVALGTLRNSAWVCSRIEPARRRPGLLFSHHAEVAALDPADQDRLLAKAEAEGLSVRTLREEVRAIRHPDAVRREASEAVRWLRVLVDDFALAMREGGPTLAKPAAKAIIQHLEGFMETAS